MDSVNMARSLMGSSLAFHIIFASLGVGIPLMIVIAEVMYQLRKDRDYAIMAKRWTKGFSIILGVAIPSGTIVGVLLGLLWPGFMEIVGQVISLPFQIEIWAFFLEAVFMSIYVFAADRLSSAMRILSVSLVAIGAAASAVLITDAHAWMNTPQGFRIVDGEVTDVDPWAAVFNPSFLTTSLHVVSSAFMFGAFAIVSLAAYKLLKVRTDDRERAYHRKTMTLGLMVGMTMSLFTAINGHSTAQMLHHYNPEKLAAAEGLFETTDYAPLAIGGIVDEETGQVKYGFEIPGALSFLATNRFDGVVRGLNEFPRENWPPLYIHLLFNLMVAIGGLLLFLSFFGLYFRFIRKKEIPSWLLRILTTTGILAMIGIETGWIFSCTGRQPWVIYHVQKTKDAAVQSDSLGTLFLLFICLYAFLLFLTVFIMLFYFKRHPVHLELEKKE